MGFFSNLLLLRGLRTVPVNEIKLWKRLKTALSNITVRNGKHFKISETGSGNQGKDWLKLKRL